MKTIKTIISAMLIAAGMTVQAQQVMTVKTDNSNDKFQLTSRLVLDLTGQRPVVRAGNQSKTFASGERILMYLMPTADDTYQIIDGIASFFNPEERFYKQITYTRNYQDKDWQLLYLPLRLEFNEWSNDFDIARLNDIHQYDTDKDGRIDKTDLNVVLLCNGYTEPNTPYVIRAHNPGTITITQNNATLYASEEFKTTVSTWNTNFTISGTYNTLEATNIASNTFYNIKNNGLLLNGNNKIDPFRWYIIVTDRNGNQESIQEIHISEFSSEEDAIISISANENSTGTIYDLSGRKVSRPAKGIYIKDGKKVLVK